MGMNFSNQWKKKFVTLCLTFSLMGCLSTLVYNSLPFWIDYYVSDYVDMTRAQQNKFDADLVQFHKWHREKELPQIQKLIQQIETASVKPASYDEIAHLHLLIQERMLASVSGLTPALANLIRSLSDEQATTAMQNVIAKVEEINQKGSERSRQDQLEKRLDNMTDRVEFWIDDVTAQQQAQLLKFATFQLDTRSTFVGIRAALVAEFRTILAARKQPNLEQKIDDWLKHIVFFNTPAYQKQMKLQSEQLYTTIFNVDSELTTKQRQYLITTLNELNQDIKGLIK